jgi:beta-phosphoglucomutase-like phosphatase (HAD superfamily)
MRSKNFVFKYALIFDLDGVLVDSRGLHYEILNSALAEIDPKYVITEEEQRVTYEGLTTKDKLEILSKIKGFPRDRFYSVWESKQEKTEKVFSKVNTDFELISIFKLVKSYGFGIGVVSNSVRKTLDSCLSSLGLKSFVDVSISNEDVIFPKPDPEGYLKAISLLGTSYGSVAIFEDSLVGREAAVRSGATLVPIDSRSDLTATLVSATVEGLKKRSKND